jgi:hypothetical protein
VRRITTHVALRVATAHDERRRTSALPFPSALPAVDEHESRAPRHVSCPQITPCRPTLRRFELVPQTFVSTQPRMRSQPDF